VALSHAILATLVGGACSGYDLRKQFEGSVGFFWQASFQQIYRELSRLEEQGLVQSQTVHQASRPDKKLYQVTEAGKAELKAWIAAPADMAPIKDDLLVKIFAGYLVPSVTLLAELRRHQIQHQERLQVYRTLEQKFFAQPEQLAIADRFRYLTLRNGIRYETEWLAWCEEAIAFLATNGNSLE
jgi:DNA-binding PadR family transcriptional regulator